MNYQELQDNIDITNNKIGLLQKHLQELHLQVNRLKCIELTQKYNFLELFKSVFEQKFVIQKTNQNRIPINLKYKTIEVGVFPTLLTINFGDDYFRIGYDDSESSWHDPEFSDQLADICKYVSNQLFKRTDVIYYVIPSEAKYEKLRTKKYYNTFTRYAQIQIDVAKIK